MRITLLLTLAGLCTAACQPAQEPVTSILIENAVVIDGSGAPRVNGAVRIDGDRMVEVGQLVALPGERVVDAHGMVLAPGFIDTHSHHDRDMDEYRHMPGVLSQGVTTIVRGADGSSGAEDLYAFISQTEFNESFAASPAAVNVASFSAHGDIRYTVMGDDFKREATAVTPVLQ